MRGLAEGKELKRDKIDVEKEGRPIEMEGGGWVSALGKEDEIQENMAEGKGKKKGQ